MPAVWTLGEWLRVWLISGFPWLLVGYSQTDSPFAGFAPLAGALGAGFAVAVTAGALAGVAVNRRASGLWPVLVVPFAGWALGKIAWTHPEEAGTRRVALVQGAVPQAIKWVREYREPTLEIYESLSAPHWGRDVVLWPESAVPAFPDEIPREATSTASCC
jgi:apolipoprotein N-acyltransferase